MGDPPTENESPSVRKVDREIITVDSSPDNESPTRESGREIITVTTVGGDRNLANEYYEDSVEPEHIPKNKKEHHRPERKNNLHKRKKNSHSQSDHDAVFINDDSSGPSQYYDDEDSFEEIPNIQSSQKHRPPKSHKSHHKKKDGKQYFVDQDGWVYMLVETIAEHDSHGDIQI